jgi:hypothetical protein
LKSFSASPTPHPIGPASAASARKPASPAAALVTANFERAAPGATFKKRLLITISSLLTTKPRALTLRMFLDGAPPRISIPQITMEPALERKTSDSYGKNAFIEPAALEAMFEPSLKELVALKRRVDPSFTLNSLFLKQKPPSYFQR